MNYNVDDNSIFFILRNCIQITEMITVETISRVYGNNISAYNIVYENVIQNW